MEKNSTQSQTGTDCKYFVKFEINSQTPQDLKGLSIEFHPLTTSSKQKITLGIIQSGLPQTFVRRLLLKKSPKVANCTYL